MDTASDTVSFHDVVAARITMPRRRPDSIARSALDTALAAALARRRVVLLCAAAGYGKTTALVQQLADPQPGRAHAWVNVHEDDDVSSLVSAMVAALDAFDPPWRQSPDGWPSLILTEQGAAIVAAGLQHGMEHADVEHGVIVLDDLHRLPDARAFAFLNLLIARLPARWTLAIASRRRPPLALARLRLQGELAEFDEGQLRFGHDDLQLLLRRQQADQLELAPLYEATQGWPVGVITMSGALRLQAAGVGGARRARGWRRRLFDYLAAEVLADLPSDMRGFMLRCSVLRELSAARCVQVSGDALAPRWLEEIERRDLFASVLETEEFTLRLHDLFRDFLEMRLLIEHPTEYSSLLLRAAAGEPDFIRRIGLLLRAGADERARDELMAHAVDIVLEGGDARLLRVIAQFPAEMRDAAPELAFARGLCAWHRYQWQTMTQAMMEASAGFERRGKPRLARQAVAFASLALNYGGWLGSARELLRKDAGALGDAESDPACLLAEYADSVLQGPAGTCSPLLRRLLHVLQSRSELQWLGFLPLHGTGRWGHRAAMEALARALSEAAEDEHSRLGTNAMLLDAVLALWQGNAARALALRDQLERESAWLGHPTKLQVALQYLAAIEKYICGDGAGARGTLRQIFDAAQQNPQRRPSLYLQLEAAFAAADGEWELAGGLQARLGALEQPHPIQPFAQAALQAELALHAGEAETAARTLDPLIQPVADVDNYSIRTRICVALARAHLRLGAADRAWQALAPALSEVRDSGETLALLMVGPAALDELVAAAWPASTDPALLLVLRDVAEQAHRLRAGAGAPAVAHSPGLSGREQQVIRLIGDGLSNKRIARELGLSPHTVKRHVARILERTGQRSRAAAAAWYVTREGDAIISP
jgi:LuxR family maltose regulon positive regulatory protein